MKRFLLPVLLILVAAVSFADFPGSPISGSSGTTNASDLTSGTVSVARGGTGSDNAAGARTNLGADNASNLSSGTLPAARIGDNVLTNAMVGDGALDLAGDKFTGFLPKANGGFGASIAAADGIPTWATGTITWNSLAAFMLRYGITFNPADNSFSFGGPVTAPEYISSATDNTRGTTVPNTADPTGSYLAAGKIWFNTTSNMTKVRNSDNNANLEVFTSGASHAGNFSTSGTLSGAAVVLDNVTSPTAAQSYGTINMVAGASTVTLPTAVVGMTACIVDNAATASDIIVDVQAGDNVVLVGVTQAGGVGITNASGSSLGDYVCLFVPLANRWMVLGKQGTWASQ